MAHYLLPIADREPLAWIVTGQRTAFPPQRVGDANRLRQDDRVLLYATRGCFHNPTRDRGRVIGLAAVAGRAEALKQPVRFGDREFPVGVELRIELLAPQRQGVELAPLVERLEAFPDPRTWSARMRRALVPISARDAKLLERELRQVALPYPKALESYAA
jgi:hypothetical protein